MGIQDRDYYWEKHKAAAKSNYSDYNSSLNRKQSRYQKKPKKSSRTLKYLLTPALMLFGLWHSADRLLKHKSAQQPTSPISTPDALARPKNTPISGGLEIIADQRGHFSGTVLINNIPMPFLIDTGATVTSIPANLAYAANLPIGGAINSNIAGGQVIDRITQINSLRIGNAEVRHLDATINQHLTEVLIGMNTLRYFNITQNGNIMTLVANGSSPQQIVRAPVPIQPNAIAVEQSTTTQAQIKRPTTIKKSVSCDEHKICSTKYSDR